MVRSCRREMTLGRVTNCGFGQPECSTTIAATICEAASVNQDQSVELQLSRKTRRDFAGKIPQFLTLRKFLKTNPLIFHHFIKCPEPDAYFTPALIRRTIPQTPKITTGVSSAITQALLIQPSSTGPARYPARLTA